jgi:hypothetical protein
VLGRGVIGRSSLTLSELAVRGLKFRTQALQFEVWGLGFRVWDSGFRVQGLWFTI